MFGYMTADLSQGIRRALSWADLSSYPIKIMWDDLPQPSKPRVPFFPWMFGYAPNYVRGQCQWWEEPSTSKYKPSWWDDPDKSVSDHTHWCSAKPLTHNQKWLHEVRIPQNLLGEQVVTLQDMTQLLSDTVEIFTQLMPFMSDALKNAES